MTRMKKDKPIQTGKVMVTCTLTITGLGCHAGSGEAWADEENALTAAEAQAFKRSCVCFGLGRYLYNFTEMWVPFNEYRQPIQFPKLPHWALPKENTKGKTHLAAGSLPAVVQHGPIDQKTTVRIQAFRRVLGDSIYGEILPPRRTCATCERHPERAGANPSRRSNGTTSRGIRKAHSLSESIGDTQFVSFLDRLHIGKISAIPNLEALRTLVSELETLAGSPAA